MRAVPSAGCLLALWIAFLGSDADAAELTLGAASEYAWTSNFFSSANDPDAANSFLIGPTLGFTHERGRFSQDIDFGGAYQFYADIDGADAWETRLRSRTSWAIDSRTTIRITDRFRDVSNLRFSRQDIELADTALEPNQNRYLRNVLDLELLRELTRNLDLSVRASHHWTEFVQNVDRNDSQAFEGASELRYQIADRHVVGIGAGYIRQDFQEALSRLGSTNDSITSFVSWNWTILDGVTFAASGGPAWIRSDYDDSDGVDQREFVGGRRGDDLFRANIASCDVDPSIGARIASNCDLTTSPIPAADLGERAFFPFGPGQGADSSDVITAFGTAALRATLSKWNLQATYSRQQNTTSGGGLVSSLDRFYAEAEFASPHLRWSTFVAGSWDRRETLTEATVVDFTVVDGGGGAARRDAAFTREDQQAERRENLTAIVGVRTAFTRHQNATFEFRYRRTEGRNQGIDQPAADAYFVVLTFAYTLDPIRF